MARIVLHLTLLAFVAFIHAVNGCHPKSFGSGSPVCVCSATQSCADELAHLNKVSAEKGTVSSFLTDKAGARFQAKELKFESAAPAAHANLEVEIDHSQKHQKIMGFGGAFSDSTGYNIGRLPKDLQGQLIQDYFGPNGIEYRYGRVTLGGSDFSTRAYSNDDHPTDESLSTFALQNEDINYKMPFMRWAKEVSKNPLRFFGSAWSAPAWMKTNHELNHGGFLRGEAGGVYYKAFAKYMVKFLQEYAKHNASFWGLTVVNEPGFGNNKGFPYNALGFSVEQQRDYIKKDLGPELHSNGFQNIALMHYDFNIDHVAQWADTILGDKDAAQYVAGTAFHWYERHKYNYSILGNIARKHPEKFMLSTEACFGYSRPGSLGDWNNFNEYAEDVIRVLNEGVQGWVDWNMVLDMEGGPSWVHTKLDAPIHVSDDGHEYYKQPLYYALGHFSKFIIPDSQRLDVHTKQDAQANNVLLTTFVRPDASVVLTVLNKNNHKVALRVHDPERGYLSVELAADSMESFVWH